MKNRKDKLEEKKLLLEIRELDRPIFLRPAVLASILVGLLGLANVLTSEWYKNKVSDVKSVQHDLEVMTSKLKKMQVCLDEVIKFEEAAQRTWVNYYKKFNSSLKNLFKIAEEKEKELTDLHSKLLAFPQDLTIRPRIIDVQMEILAIAERTSRTDLDLRDKLKSELDEQRRGIIDQIKEGNCDNIIMPVES